MMDLLNIIFGKNSLLSTHRSLTHSWLMVLFEIARGSVFAAIMLLKATSPMLELVNQINITHLLFATGEVESTS